MGVRIHSLLLAVALIRGDVIDRAVVSVGQQVVTESAIRRHLQMAAFLQGGTPDFGAASRRAAAERLVDQTLIRREIELSRFAPVPVSDVDRQLQALRNEKRLDAEAFRAALARAGLTTEELTDEIQWQLTLFRFIEFRFRPGVQVTEQELRVYYDGELAGLARKEGTPLPPFEEAETSILRILTERKVQGALEQWLEQMRQLVRIRYRAEVSP